MSRGSREIVARQQRVADHHNIAKPLDHASNRQRRDFGAVIFRQNLTRLGIAAFGKRGGDRGRQYGPARDRGLHRLASGCDPIHEIGVDQKRRQGINRRCDLRLVAGQRDDHRRRRCRAGSERVGERAAHQWRWIVEQLEHQTFGRRELVGRQIRAKKSARQGARRLGAFIRRGSLQPLQEFADDRHRQNHTIRMRFQA